MKVSYVTLPESLGVLRHLFAAGHALLTLVMLGACHHAQPGAAPLPATAPLEAPPVEAVWIRIPSSVADVAGLIRAAMYNIGVQVAAENRQKQWVRAGLGGAWDDPYRYREWHLLANYGADSTAAGTLVVVRAIESRTSYLASLGRPAAGNPQAGNGFTRTHFVSNLSTGDSRAAWSQLELLVSELSVRGGELLTDLSGLTRRAGRSPNPLY